MTSNEMCKTVQDCYKSEHHPALSIVDVRSIAMPQRITIRQFCSGTVPIFVEAVVWQKKSLPIIKAKRSLAF